MNTLRPQYGRSINGLGSVFFSASDIASLLNTSNASPAAPPVQAVPAAAAKPISGSFDWIGGQDGNKTTGFHIGENNLKVGDSVKIGVVNGDSRYNGVFKVLRKGADDGTYAESMVTLNIARIPGTVASGTWRLASAAEAAVAITPAIVSPISPIAISKPIDSVSIQPALPVASTPKVVETPAVQAPVSPSRPEIKLDVITPSSGGEGFYLKPVEPTAPVNPIPVLTEIMKTPVSQNLIAPAILPPAPIERPMDNNVSMQVVAAPTVETGKKVGFKLPWWVIPAGIVVVGTGYFMSRGSKPTHSLNGPDKPQKKAIKAPVKKKSIKSLKV